MLCIKSFGTLKTSSGLFRLTGDKFDIRSVVSSKPFQVDTAKKSSSNKKMDIHGALISATATSAATVTATSAATVTATSEYFI
jgi:hypothetical protein